MTQHLNSIPAFDNRHQYAVIEPEVSAVVLDILASGRYIGGPILAEFEQAFAAYHHVSTAIGCNSGTDALFLALRGLGIGAGDEVITTPFTFIATSEVVSAVGATPVFVDIDPITYNLDINQVAAAITPQTKAIIPVHLFGQAVDMDALMQLATTHNLSIIEDCAQATGATWGGKKVGSIGHVGCFSFYPTKNLGAFGDGGAITTNDPELVAKIRMIKEHGQRNRYYYEEVGINSRLDAIQAAILKVKLPYLDKWNQQRRAIAQRYQEYLHAVPGIILPQQHPGGESVWNQYTIRVIDGQRDNFRQKLQDQGVNTMVYYPMPLHLQPVYQHLGYQPGQLPVSEQICHEVVSLPMFPELSMEQQDRVISAIQDFSRE